VKGGSVFILRRITKEPASPIRILVDAPQGDGDLGMTLGGSFYFFPAGSEEGSDRYQVSRHAVEVIMGDPGLAKHFECTPPWPPAAEAPAEAAAETDEQPATAEEPPQAAPRARRRRKAAEGQGEETSAP